jgi:hypothetical protein
VGGDAQGWALGPLLSEAGAMGPVGVGWTIGTILFPLLSVPSEASFGLSVCV